MAIYHFSVKNVSRSKGQSVVACSAYRAGEKLIDERYGKEQDYTKKTGVEFKKIYAPTNAKKELLNREKLWNTVEAIETRKNSQLSREFELAFPHELNQEQREQMLNELCEKIVERHNVIVDAVIHAPHTAGGSDERNYHAHVMFTTRSINERGELDKKTREFNDNGKDEVQHWRESFAELCNRHLERAGSHERVDHRSYAERGLEFEPTVHEGSKITELRRQGIDTEISLKNDAIKARNAEIQLIRGLEQEIIATERLVANLQRDQEQQIAKHQEKQPQQRTDAEKLQLASKIFTQFNSKVNDLARTYAMQYNQEVKEKFNHDMALVQREKTSLEQQMQNMGNRPRLFGAKDWDAKKDRLQADWHRATEKEKELKGELQKRTLDANHFKDKAFNDVSKDNPKARENFDKANVYREKQLQQKEPQKDQDKQAERQARLEQARAIGEAEKANKAQLDKEREQRAEARRNDRMK